LPLLIICIYSYFLVMLLGTQAYDFSILIYSTDVLNNSFNIIVLLGL